MDDVILKIVAAVTTAFAFCVLSLKMLGAMQQSGYQNGTFLRWLKRKDNLYFNRLWVLSLCFALATSVTSLCFSFLGTRAALLISSIPFFALLLLFGFADRKYALKVSTKTTGRLRRLFAVYVLMTACVSYVLVALLWFLSKLNGSQLYAFIAYAPFAIMPMLLPLLLCLANGITGIFENARNKKFVKRAGQVLDESKITRVAVVGSYGKTSVKNILKTLLSEKYTVLETPESYNTPIGIAKTVTSSDFKDKQIFIAEMGARKNGDISLLCGLVKPDYAVFTGVCSQHIATFGSEENVWKEKSEILKCGVKKVVCGEELRQRIQTEFSETLNEKVVFANRNAVEQVQLGATSTSFVLVLGDQKIEVTTALLGETAVENILLAATLGLEMGLTVEEIGRGVEKLQPIAHRLQLVESNGAYILDDGYNCNPRGAKEAIEALKRFAGKKCIVTPGIVECGVLEEKINGELGEQIANANLDKVILVGQTLVGAVKSGYDNAGGNAANIKVVKTLEEAKTELSQWIETGAAVLFLNDLPDVY